jgi:hypothetical protein
MNITNNGRVDIKTPNTSALFELYDRIPANQCVTFRNPTEGLWTKNNLSDAFFSLHNIEVLQMGIINGVYNRSNGQYEIGPQDCDTLKVIMRSIFLQYAANKPNDIQQQVQQLNKMVLEYCIQQVYSEAQGYMQYLNDASTLVIPIAHPVMASQNDRQLELKSWF